MRQKDFIKILAKYKKGLCTPEEQALVDNWFKAMEVTEDKAFADHALDQTKERSWARVRDHIVSSRDNHAEGGQRAVHFGQRQSWAIAACVAFLAASIVYYILSPGKHVEQRAAVEAIQQTIKNDTPSEMEVVLKDGSRVLLKPKSKISLPEPFSQRERLVALEGEAFFEVSRDTLRPFLVNTREVVTKVLGTSFTVSAFLDQDNITVSVMSGKVSVITKKDPETPSGLVEETILTPNQKIVYNRIQQMVSRGIVREPLPVRPAEAPDRMYFEAAPIHEIFKGLEQVYGVEIQFDKDQFSKCILTTSIGEGSIYNRLDMICKAIDAEYVIEENHIVISGPGCHR